MLDFKGKTAIVTGAGRGLGRSHALLLASRGANVVVNDLGTSTAEGEGADLTPAEEVVREIVQAGGKAVANGASVATTEGAESIVADAIDNFGGVDVVVNNAGILTVHEIPKTGLDEFERELGVHLIGSFNVTRAAWPHMAEKGYGRVVMTTSCGIFGSPVLMSYGAAKAGIIGMARNLAVNGLDCGIKVNMVAPYALTRMADPDLPVNKAARSEVEEEVDESAMAVFGRLYPERVSAVVAYLAHESCSLNGEILSAGGGFVARMFVAETKGWGHPELTPEHVAENLERIVDDSEYVIPGDVTDYTNKFVPRVPEPAATAAQPATP